MLPSQVTIDGISGTIQQDGMVKFGSDDHLNVVFYKKSVHNPNKSRELGMPWSEDVDYVRIQHPGERDVRDMPVSDDPNVVQRFARQWFQYQKNQEQIPSGTPVECLFPQSPAIAANLHGMGVHTVQQLATLSAEGEQLIGMGATQWKNKAKEFLASAEKGVGTHKLQKELEDRDNKIEVLGHQLAQVQAQLERLLAEKQGVPQAMIPNYAAQAAVPSVIKPKTLPASAFENQAGFQNQVIEPAPKRRGRPPKAA